LFSSVRLVVGLRYSDSTALLRAADCSYGYLPTTVVLRMVHTLRSPRSRFDPAVAVTFVVTLLDAFPSRDLLLF